MRIFKLMDFWLQIVFITASFTIALVGACIGGETGSLLIKRALLIGIFAAGGWQITSMLIHAFFRDQFYHSKGRRTYALTVLGLLFYGALIAITLNFATLVFLYLAILSLIAPICTFWYLSICYHENKVLAYKRLIHLK